MVLGLINKLLLFEPHSAFLFLKVIHMFFVPILAPEYMDEHTEQC